MEQAGNEREESPEIKPDSYEVGFKKPPKAKQFSSENQPPPSVKSTGQLKRKRNADLAKAMLQLPFKGNLDGKLRKAISEYFGVKEKDITVEMMMTYRQIEKAIQKADTNAFNTIMDRAHGKVKQKHELTGENGSPLAAAVINVQSVNTAPPIGESEDAIS